MKYYEERQEILSKIEEALNADVYVLFTAMNERYYSLVSDFLTLFTEAIWCRRGNRRENAVLVMETNGGDPTTAMAIVKQLRENYSNIYGYVWNRCLSAGTIAMFATDKIYMSHYAFLSPVDFQTILRDDKDYHPVLANYNAFILTNPTKREKEFAKEYSQVYLNAITLMQYAKKSIYPNFLRHVKKEYAESSWEYFNGGAGLHSSKINYMQAKNELGMTIERMPDEIEELFYELISNYIDDSQMLISSLCQSEEKDAFFETLGMSYTHYIVYDINEVDNQVDVGRLLVAGDVDFGQKIIECGWRREEEEEEEEMSVTNLELTPDEVSIVFSILNYLRKDSKPMDN